MRIITLLGFYLLLPSLVLASVYSGRVIDEITQEGLPAATLTSVSGESTRTDLQGYFTLESLQPQVRVQLAGFEDQIQTLESKDNVIALKLRGVYQVQAVKVRAKPDDKKVLVSKQQVQKEEVKKTTTTIFPDVAHVIQSLPGVTTNSDFSGLLYVRGGDPDEVVATLDEMIIMTPYLWGGRLSIFNPNLVDTIEFYAGGYPAEANQAMSALMQIKNKTGNPDKYQGFLDLSAATANVLVEGPLGLYAGSSFIVGLRRTHYDLLVEAVSSDNSVYPYFYDGQAKLTFPTSSGTLTLQSLFSFEGMDLVLSEAEGFGEDHPQETRFDYLIKRNNSSLAYDYRLSENINVLTLVGLRWDDGFYTFTDFYSPSDVKTLNAFLQARHVWQILLGEHHIIKTGGYMITGRGDYSINNTVKIPTLSGYHTDRIETKMQLNWPVFAGMFVQDDMELVPDSIFLNPGVNAQYYTGNRQWVVNPRLAIKWKLTADWEWHVATGIYSQHPMEADLLDKKYGNPQLKAQESIHYILGTKLDIGQDFFIQGEIFYKDYRHLIVSDANPDINYTNQGEGQAYGFDIILQKKLGGNWDGWLTYSYVTSQRRIISRSDPQDFGLNPGVVPVGEWYHSSSERPHALSLILNYEFASDWKLAITQKYMSGTLYTPVSSAIYVASIDEYVPRYGDYNSERLPAYMNTDIKLSMPFFDLKGWSAYLQAINLFDIKNVDQYYYNKDYTQKKALYQLPRMIIGGIRWEF